MSDLRAIMRMEQAPPATNYFRAVVVAVLLFIIGVIVYVIGFVAFDLDGKASGPGASAGEVLKAIPTVK